MVGPTVLDVTIDGSMMSVFCMMILYISMVFLLKGMFQWHFCHKVLCFIVIILAIEVTIICQQFDSRYEYCNSDKSKIFVSKSH